MAEDVRIAVLMTCHNRRALTLACLEALRDEPLFVPGNLFLVDDGSSDGTGEAVAAAWPAANVIQGDGTLFWNGGMRLAWDMALAAPTEFSHYFWLNDDVTLLPRALSAMLADAQAVQPADGALVVAGGMADPDTGEQYYGGQVALDPARPLRMTIVAATGAPVKVLTMSGNAVLVSAPAARRLGNLDPQFEHIFGDLDYGLRATAAGIPVYQAGAIAGLCARQGLEGSTNDPALSRWARLRVAFARFQKIHARDWRRFARRHSGLGPLSWVYGLSPFVRAVLDRPKPILVAESRT